MKFRLLATVSMSTLVMTGAAGAADMLVKAPKAPPPPPMSWTGFYLGASGGFASFRTSATAVDENSDAGAGSVTGTGGIFGGQIGANWQLQTFVLGAEADFSGFSNLEGSTSFFETGPVAETETLTHQITSLGTARGRVGVLVAPMVLLYGTGGFAWGKVNDQLPVAFGGFSSSGTRTGWTAGGGVEWMVAPHWSVKAEGLYVDLGSSTVGNTLGSGYSATFKDTAAIGRVGVNVHF